MTELPAKKRARLDDPTSQQSKQLKQLFSNPDREIKVEKPNAKNLQAPPEIVANVQGSSAGAGSGEFHVYKASRRREMERLAIMDEETKNEIEQQEWERKREDMRILDEERTAKKRAKRQKRKGGGKEIEAKGNDDGRQHGVAKTGKLKPIILPQANGMDAAESDDAADKYGHGEEEAEESGIVIHDDD